MDKKYNGFNNGRDKSDGVGGREVNHGIQQTMTKEQILMSVPIDPTGTEHFTEKEAIQAMEEYAKQEVAKEREKAKKLMELLHEIDKSLYIGDDLNDIVILKWYLDVIGTIKDEIKKSLTEYKK